ncbi:Fe-S cluster assembly ATPase SufC [Abyssibacter sp.]|uniref:Fe-S cluster assembly ATPase SufC n=1 Tax=Abyssibacter sp. TaxID=2320200 RepID=UPI0025C6F1D0|nr:Fe-S cluster assembly ATPase SufC [Abyssibacter sp.]MCK5859010.1 Fe-S cluster assembly ATPase SufC [Abyssibacter sp.]
MLEIKNLHASVDDKAILKGIDLTIGAGEIHAVMGPNGSGKSTLGGVLSGRPGYVITEGSVHFNGKDLLEMEPEERAVAGLFLGFQYPVEIPGVSNAYFMKAAVNAWRVARGEPEIDAMGFLADIRKAMEALELPTDMIHRGVNEGFSGGEKKRNEIVQMQLLKPKLSILDETDSGLDIDALKLVSNGINALRSAERSFVLITHYQRLLDYVQPDHVHVLAGGRIVRSGGEELARELEERGYGWVTGEAA